MYELLESINHRPQPFEYYTAEELWTNEHTAEQMLQFHLNEAIDVSSRKIKFIDRSVDWIISHCGVDEGKSVVDFGCGPGLYTTRLAQSGAEVMGIDFSANSINYARSVAQEKGFEIDYLNLFSFDELAPVGVPKEGDKYILAAAVYLGDTRLIDNVIFKL